MSNALRDSNELLNRHSICGTCPTQQQQKSFLSNKLQLDQNSHVRDSMAVKHELLMKSEEVLSGTH